MSSPVWHPFTQHGLGQSIVTVARAQGSWITTVAGDQILDAISSWWVVTHGHRHPAIMAAIKAQADKLDQVIFAGFTHWPAEELAQELVRIAPPGLRHVFYSDSGSTAVEVGLKMALGYWRNVGEKRTRILALEHAYHGDTVGTMSAGARGAFTASYEPLLFDVGRVPFPAAGREQASLDALEAALKADPIAALIVEPLILGAGGMLVYPAWVLKVMARLCAQHGALFIADEVMTGWGRTGTLFACEQAGITPDILCVAKGLTGGSLPLAATLCVPKIFEAHVSSDRAAMFFHSSSYTANPIACAAAVANLAVWRDEPVLQRVGDICKWQTAMLAEFAEDQRFSGVRQCGTITALDLKVTQGGYLSELAPKLADWFIEERCTLLRPLGNTIYIMPPYCFDEYELRAVYDDIRAAADLFGSGA